MIRLYGQVYIELSRGRVRSIDCLSRAMYERRLREACDLVERDQALGVRGVPAQ